MQLFQIAVKTLEHNYIMGQDVDPASITTHPTVILSNATGTSVFPYVNMGDSKKLIFKTI